MPVGTLAWFPWQEALGVVGLEAAYQVTGHQPARDIAVEVARSVVQYGFQPRNGGMGDVIATAIAYVRGGEVDRNDVTKYLPSDGTAFTEWAAACVKLALRWGISALPYGTPIQTLWDGIAARYNVVPPDAGFTRWESWSGV